MVGERMVRGLAVQALALLLAFSACGATKLRLVYGESWSPSGRAVRAMLESFAFRNESKGRYTLEFVKEEGGKPSPENLGSFKLPALFVITDVGNCYCVIDNVPKEVTAKQLLKKIQKVDALRKQYEKEGFDTAEKCGEFLQKIERFVGGPRRVIAKGFYEDVFERLKKLDPYDKTGWQRHFTLGTDVDKSAKADGLEIVIKANEYREKGQIYEGETYIRKQQRELPARHLTLEQKQALLMARFALYRESYEMRGEMVALLKRVAEAGEETFWGTAALGWLNTLGQPPLSTYWGWHKGDFTGPRLNATVTYGAGYSFPKEGKYTIRFVRDAGSIDLPRFDAVQLFAGKEEVATVGKPQVDGASTTFAFELPREYRGRITALVVRGAAGADGNSSGKIEILRNVLRPRKEAK